jgi:hypothetical protein
MIPLTTPPAVYADAIARPPAPSSPSEPPFPASTEGILPELVDQKAPRRRRRA